MKNPLLNIVTCLGLAASLALGATPPATTNSSGTTEPATTTQIAPTFANVRYGDHERQVLDFYQAKSDTPTPVVFFLHGGAWSNGSKDGANNTPLKQYLDAGISAVYINYRFVRQAMEAKVQPPVSWPMHDAARALQLVRSKASEWNIDKQRIGGSGNSAGACTILWLALHDDLADLKSTDPIARESTRLWCAGVNEAQTSLDPQQMKEWTPNSNYGGHAFGFRSAGNYEARVASFAKWLEHRDEVLPWIKEYSPYEHVTADDPPIYMYYPAQPKIGEAQKDPTHTANFGVKLGEKLKEAGVAFELLYPRASDVKHKTAADYLIATLKEQR